MLSFQPRRHAFTAYAVPWYRFLRDIKSFAEHAVKADGAPDLPCQRPALSIAAKEKG